MNRTMKSKGKEKIMWILPVIFPLASRGGCQLTMTARGFPSRVITVRSLGADVGAENSKTN